MQEESPDRWGTFARWFSAGGIALLLASLFLPWSARRACPLFEECSAMVQEWGPAHTPWLLAVGLAILLPAAVAPLLRPRSVRMLGAGLAVAGTAFAGFLTLLATFQFMSEWAGWRVGAGLGLAGVLLQVLAFAMWRIHDDRRSPRFVAPPGASADDVFEGADGRLHYGVEDGSASNRPSKGNGQE